MIQISGIDKVSMEKAFLNISVSQKNQQIIFKKFSPLQSHI